MIKSNKSRDLNAILLPHNRCCWTFLITVIKLKYFLWKKEKHHPTVCWLHSFEPDISFLLMILNGKYPLLWQQNSDITETSVCIGKWSYSFTLKLTSFVSMINCILLVWIVPHHLHSSRSGPPDLCHDLYKAICSSNHLVPCLTAFSLIIFCVTFALCHKKAWFEAVRSVGSNRGG